MKTKKKSIFPKEKYEHKEEASKSGGNGSVYIVKEKSSGKEYALKMIKNFRSDTEQRFCYEIDIVLKNQNNIEGIIPIHDFSKEHLWYSMEKAIPIEEYLKTKKKNYVTCVVDGIIQICETLIPLHQKGVSHRDIKPENILFYNERFCLGDFGLAYNPELTKNEHKTKGQLGPKDTMPPEYRRYPERADGKKADVYMLAKTMWRLLAKKEYGFDGVYSCYSDEYGLTNFDTCKNRNIAEIEDLITIATADNPAKRPTIEKFLEILNEWKKNQQDFLRSEKKGWQLLHKRIFHDEPIPLSSKWGDFESIVEILNYFQLVRTRVHIIFPDGGGLDFTRAEIAGEKNCIYLITEDFYSVVSPKILYFENLGEDYTWNYFLLELNNLTPILDQNEKSCEELCEDTPGHYINSSTLTYGVYDYEKGTPLPKDAKLVARYLSGRVLFVPATGNYNSIPATYDGRQSDAKTAEEFKEYMEILKQTAEETSSDTIKTISILNNPDNSQNIFIPSKDKHSKKTETIENTLAPYKDALNFLKEEDFSSLIQDKQSTNEKWFYIELEEVIKAVSFDALDEEETHITLTENGRFETGNPFYFNSRTTAVSTYKEIMERIKDYFEKKYSKSFATVNWDLQVKFNTDKFKLPRIFTKEEIRNCMKEADDRKYNWIVIDENGYPKAINDIDFKDAFPIKKPGSFHPGKNYVGKYSELSEVDSVYKELLWEYRCILKKEDNPFGIYSKCIEDIISEIEELETT